MEIGKKYYLLTGLQELLFHAYGVACISKLTKIRGFVLAKGCIKLIGFEHSFFGNYNYPLFIIEGEKVVLFHKQENFALYNNYKQEEMDV